MSHMTGAQVRILWNMFALCAGAFSLSIIVNLHAFLTTHTVHLSHLYQHQVVSIIAAGRPCCVTRR
jgi:hypothetical protein